MIKKEIPKNWEGVTVEQFIELSTVAPSDFETSTGFEIERYCILTGSDEDEVEEMDLEEFIGFSARTIFLNEDPKGREETVGDFHFMNFERLTLGNFIDLEAYFAAGHIEKLPEIIATLYRKTKRGEWGELIFEPMGVIDFDERLKIVLEFPVGKVFGIIEEYLTFKDGFLKQRGVLFGLEPEDPEDEKEDEDEEFEIEVDGDEDEKEDVNDALLSKWSWELFLYNLAGGDLTKIDAITELNLIFVFNFAAMKHELKIEN